MYAVIEQWKGSGKSQQSICKEAGISLHIFKYWLNKQRTEEAAIDNTANNKGPFIPLSVEHPAGFPDVQILYPNGVTVSCSGPVTANQLQELIKLF